MTQTIQKTFAVGLTVIGLGLCSTPAGAHHSFAMFDNDKEVTLEGQVREFQWTNPHSWIQLVVVENGASQEYSVEGASPNGLKRRGWTRESFKPGDRIKLTIHPLKNGSKGGSFVRAVFPDGKTVS